MKSTCVIRCWRIQDASFIIKVRNSPELQQWFKQDKDLTLEQQEDFMRFTAPEIGYYGFIIEMGTTPIGICSLILGNGLSAEFGIALLPEYQRKGFATMAMQQLLSLAFNNFKCNRVYSDVFVKNPALSWYIHKLGFTAYGVKEKAYMKHGQMVDTVLIEQLA